MFGEIEGTIDSSADANIGKTAHDNGIDYVKSSSDRGSCFKDGVSKIEAVLCYVVDDKDKLKDEKEKWRERFFSSLENEYHLRLEPGSKEISVSGNEDEEWEVEHEGDDQDKGQGDGADQRLNATVPPKVNKF